MQKKVSMWPLYAADALMFLAVFFMALPNIFLKEPLETGQAFALVLVVLVAMCLVLLPHFFAYRLDIDAAKIAEQKKRDAFAEEIRQIFADLRTLRDSLMEQIKFAEKSAGEIETLQIALRNMRAEIEKFSGQDAENSKIKSGLAAAMSAIESLKQELSDFEKKSSSENGDHLKYLSDKLEKLSAESASKFEILDDICSQLQALGDAYAEADEAEENAEELDEETEEAEPEEDTEEETEESEEGAEAEAEEELSEDETEEDFGNDDDYEDLEGEAGEEAEASEAEAEAEEVEEGAETEEEPAESAPKGNPKWEGMLDKALQNSQAFSTRETVSKFIEKNKAETTEANGQANLFDADALPQSHKPVRARSGDTAVVVNAFLGIGNIPYIRGNGAGLSPDKGVPMDLLEIGKYQWKCAGMISEPLKISIWLNDETPSNLGELALNPNETLDVEPSF